MISTIRLAIFGAITVALAACGGGSGGGSGAAPTTSPGTATTTILSYDVTGQTPLTNDVIPVNPGLSSGEFFATWQVTSSNPFRVRLYVSEDTNLDAAVSDVRIYNNSCGASTTLYSCQSTYTERCTFGMANTIRCGTVSAANPEQDLTIFLDTIPKNAFVIAEICDAVLSDCKQSTHAIQFQ